MGVASGKTEARGPAVKFLSAEELIAVFDALSDADKLKLDRIEAHRRGGTGFKRGDLLRTAMCDGILGKRHCPRDLPVIAFLAQTMRSIASHERERSARSTPLHEVPREGEAAPAATAVSKAVDAMAVTEMERTTRSEDTVETILAHFADDEVAQLIVLGWIDNCRGEALRELTGLSQSELDYKIRYIRTKMRKHYPNGWTP
jgi:hypothetical protein